MIAYWQIISNGITPIQEYINDCIVNVINPTEQEISILRTTFDVPEDIISDILDVDERSRIEFEEDQLIIILRIPLQTSQNGIPFTTIPLGLIVTKKNIVVICREENQVLSEFFNRHSRKKVIIQNHIDFILNIFLHSTNIFHRYLKQINNQTNEVEQDLAKSVRNEELQKLLKLEKCLVYFTTSLRSNDYLLSRLKNSKTIRMNENTEDLLEDVMIENRQAIEMANIYSDIQSGLMDAFASVISNNLNIVMKRLTSISIILMIPTLVASFFGMNVPNFFETSKIGFISIVILSALISLTAILIFRKKKWF
jgi:magnesium transporter